MLVDFNDIGLCSTIYTDTMIMKVVDICTYKGVRLLPLCYDTEKTDIDFTPHREEGLYITGFFELSYEFSNGKIVFGPNGLEIEEIV